jgi:uncharacterized protein (DUF2267 family)
MMAETSIPNFSHAAEQAQQWVNELAEDLGWSQCHAYHLLKVVLTALRDWLSPEEVADLSAQLPVLIRGIYFEGWDPSVSSATERRRRDFVMRVEHGLGDETNVDYSGAISAVLSLLDRHISQGESVQVRNSMKKSLRQLWPAH